MRWPIGLLCLSLVAACDDGAEPTPTPAADAALIDSGSAEDLSVADAAPLDDGVRDAAAVDLAVMDDLGGAPDQAVADAQPGGPCAPADPPAVHRITVPLGETLFFEGDDYLVPFDDGLDCPVVAQGPEGATAAPIDGRLTPDVPGAWVLTRAGVRVEADVQADFLNPDTFVNYNYTPATALAALSDDELLVVSPPSNAIQRVTVSADGAQAGALIPTGSWPTGVAVWGDYALVTQTGRDSLGFVDLTVDRVVDAIRVGDEPAGIVVAGDTAYVTLSGEDRVAQIDLVEKAVTGTLPVGRDPRALALSPDGASLYVLSLNSSNAHRFGPPDRATEPMFQRDLTVVDVPSWTVRETVPELGTILRGLWAAPDGRVVVGVSHSRNQEAAVDAETDPHRHGLAVVTWGEDGQAQVRQVALDRALPAPSPFTLAPTPDGALLAVTLSAGKALLLLDPDTFDEVARLQTGNDPRGLVFAHGRAWTTAWLDNQVEGHAVPPVLGRPPVSVGVGRDPTPPDVKAGQRIFNDATFSRYGKFSCNNCHIDGLTDGLVWDLLVDGEVNTLAFRNVAGTDPFLWGGQLPTLFDFSREVLRLVGAQATGEQMQQLTLYMQSITAPPNPFSRPGGRYTDAALRGKALFDGVAGCVGCHSGPLLTNGATVDGKTRGKATDVPGLIGVYDTAPYGREAQWATLGDMLDFALEYTGASPLSDGDRADLLAYLQQLPGPALWLNSARPLSGADHVWAQTPIELTFSHGLAPGQVDRFSLVFDDGEGGAVPGAWEVRGRVARFLPEGGALENETAYRIEVQAPLRGALGQVLDSALQLQFSTGGEPEIDISGRFMGTLGLAQFGIVDEDPQATVAAIQAPGGNVTGVLEGLDDLVQLSHVEGVVSGTRFVIDPFLLATRFGDFQVESAYLDLVDDDGDGFADTGAGVIRALGTDVRWSAERLAD